MSKLELYQNQMISYKVHSFGFKGLIKNEERKLSEGVLFEVPNLEDIMIYYAKKEEDHEEFII
jgi:ABC-2 type transport system ATP-binding protein